MDFTDYAAVAGSLLVLTGSYAVIIGGTCYLAEKTGLFRAYEKAEDRVLDAVVRRFRSRITEERNE